MRGAGAANEEGGTGRAPAMSAEQELTAGQKKDVWVLATFVAVFCAGKHPDRAKADASQDPGMEGVLSRPLSLCDECRELLAYAVRRRRLCPLDPKPSCKHCHVHCYRKGHRERIREVMAYSGKRLIKRGRLDLIWHYFF